MRREVVADPLTQQLLANEANTVARVRSPYVSSVIEVGDLDGERPYLAMDDLPADLELVLRIGLARDANDRFASAVDPWRRD